MRLKYNVDTQVVVQIGDPLDHASGMYMFNCIFEYANLNAVAIPVVVKKGHLKEFIDAARVFKINGFGITMPHKADIIPFLDECDPASRAVKCVNNVKFDEEGRTIGIGLDGVGLGMSLDRENYDVKGKNVLMLGAGGVASSIAAELCRRGAETIYVANRTAEKARFIQNTMKDLYDANVKCLEWEDKDMCRLAPDIDLVMQCTSLRSDYFGDHEEFNFVRYLRDDTFVADVNYPSTKLLSQASKRGLKNMNGSIMLMQQQIAHMKWRFGIDLDQGALDEMEEAIDIGVVMRNKRDKRLGIKRKE